MTPEDKSKLISIINDIASCVSVGWESDSPYSKNLSFILIDSYVKEAKITRGIKWKH